MIENSQSSNVSFSADLNEILNVVEPYYIITIIIVGLIGNSISFLLFLFSKLKFEQANYILAALAFADNGFLVSLLLVNLKHFEVNLIDNFQLTCKLSVYFTYLFSFLSTWYVVAFSIERLIAVYFPMNRYNFCNRNRNKLSVFSLVLFSGVFYSYSLFTSGLEHINFTDSKLSCVTLEKWFDLVKLMAFLDTLLTMFIPFILIFISNISIVWKLMRFKSPVTFLKESVRSRSNSKYLLTESSQYAVNTNRRKSTKIQFGSILSAESFKAAQKKNVKLYRRNEIEETKNFRKTDQFGQEFNGQENKIKRSDLASTSLLAENNIYIKKESFVNLLSKNVEIKRLQKYSRTTRMLLTISTTFLILHFPIAICKIWYFIKSFNLDSESVNKSLILTADKSQLNVTLSVNRETKSSYETSSSEEILERISCYIYYLNFSLNFFLYALNGPKFRKAIVNVFRRQSNFGKASMRSRSTVI